jgi:hypothetical protein
VQSNLLATNPQYNPPADFPHVAIIGGIATTRAAGDRDPAMTAWQRQCSTALE